MLMALSTSPTVPWVRVPDPSEGWIKRALDAGAATVMVPRVDDLDTARRLAGYRHLRPGGTPRRRRRHRPRRRAGVATPLPYLARWRAEGGLALQIESPQGLEIAADMAAIPGVTQLFFGPSDFAAALGTGRDDPRVAAAARTVAAAARAAGTHRRHRHLPRPRLRRARRPRLHPRPRRRRHPAPRRRPRREPRRRPQVPVVKGDLPIDPRGLIAEAYRMDIGPEDCRTIFLDWALGLPEGAGPPRSPPSSPTTAPATPTTR